jgi:hypothetical protein
MAPADPLHVRMPFSSSSVKTFDYFTVGSTKNEVLAVQGTPSSLSANEWGYGLSRVYFRNDKVDSWSVVPGYPLKVRIPSLKQR